MVVDLRINPVIRNAVFKKGFSIHSQSREQLDLISCISAIIEMAVHFRKIDPLRRHRIIAAFDTVDY